MLPVAFDGLNGPKMSILTHWKGSLGTGIGTNFVFCRNQNEANEPQIDTLKRKLIDLDPSPSSWTIATKSLSTRHIIAQQGSYDVTL
jgi:hypothetical protein